MLKGSTTTSLNNRNLEVLRGRDGRDGFTRPKRNGWSSVPGPKEERAGEVIYVHWGHDTCPDGRA